MTYIGYVLGDKIFCQLTKSNCKNSSILFTESVIQLTSYDIIIVKLKQNLNNVLFSKLRFFYDFPAAQCHWVFSDVHDFN